MIFISFIRHTDKMTKISTLTTQDFKLGLGMNL